jgi:hypothetical protein
MLPLILHLGVWSGDKWNDWLHLCQRLMMAQLSDNPDKFVWKLTTSHIFTVKSMYLDLINGHTRFLRTFYGSSRFHLRLKFSCGF